MTSVTRALQAQAEVPSLGQCGLHSKTLSQNHFSLAKKEVCRNCGMLRAGEGVTTR